MTAFEDAARAEAEDRWPDADEPPYRPAEVGRAAFEAGAVWARDHLTAEEPSYAEALESAARDLPMDCHDPRHMADWLRARAARARRGEQG